MATASAAVAHAARSDVRAQTGAPWLFRICLAATASTYLLIVAGAAVRVTGSGLGCPDWPTCHGRIIPPLETTALIEYTHRLIGAIATPLILAVPVGAWLARRPLRILLPAVAIPALLATQIVLGAVVVRLELPPMVVLVHLGFAMLILGGLVWVTAFEGRRETARVAPTRRSLAAPLAGLTVLAFVLVLSGAYTRATGASWACTGFPGCDVVQPAVRVSGGAGDPVAVHLFHRALAYATAAAGLLAAAVLWRRRDGDQRAAAALLALALVAQGAIGAWAVSTGLPAPLRGAHVAGAAAVWAATVLCLALEARRSLPLREGNV